MTTDSYPEPQDTAWEVGEFRKLVRLGRAGVC